MNRHELYLFFLVTVHMFVWLYVAFAWVLPHRKKHIAFVLFFLLPLVFIVQSLPCHFIVYLKFKYIMQHMNAFRTSNSGTIAQIDVQIAENISKTLGMSVNEIIEILAKLKYYEELYTITYYFDRAKKWFDNKTFMNPFGPHGMIIIGYIINTFAMKFV